MLATLLVQKCLYEARVNAVPATFRLDREEVELTRPVPMDLELRAANDPAALVGDHETVPIQPARVESGVVDQARDGVLILLGRWADRDVVPGHRWEAYGRRQPAAANRTDR